MNNVLKAATQSRSIMSIVTFAVRLSGGAANYALFAVVSQWNGPENFGLFSISFSIAMAFALVGSFGQQIFLMKEVPRHEALGNFSLAKGAYLYSTISTALFSFLAGAACLIFITKNTIVESHVASFAAACLATLYGLSQTSVGALRVQDRLLLALASRDLLWRLASIIGIAAISIVYGHAVTPQHRVAISLLTITGCIVPILLYHIYVVSRAYASSYRAIVSKVRFKEWTDTSLGMTLVSLISGSDAYVYTILLGILVGPLEAGAFFASLKTVELLNMFLMAVTMVTSPDISKAIALKDSEDLQRICIKSVLLQGIPAATAAFFIVILASPLLSLFSKSYSEFAWLLRLLAFGMLINALTGATVLMLQLMGRHWLQVGIQGGSLLISLALLPVLTTHFGIFGAGFSFVFSKLLWNVIAVYVIKRGLDVDPSILAIRQADWGQLSAMSTTLYRKLRNRRA